MTLNQEFRKTMEGSSRGLFV